MSKTAGGANFFNRPTQNGTSGTRNIPWVEKYRPKSVVEVSAQDEVVLLFKSALETGELPNLLFYGPPGTGKTSSILALARDLFGSDLIKSRVLELNASDERGIQVIREKVKTFAQLAVANSVHSITKKPIPSFKIIILDEADSMTSSAQAALRRMMEIHSRSTRFCLICNYITKLIDPITSRCSKYFFKPLPLDSCMTCLCLIRDRESLSISNECLEFLIKHSEGDLRKAIMLLQSCCYFSHRTEIKRSDVESICEAINDDLVDNLISLCFSRDFNSVQAASKEFIKNGFSVTKFISQFHDSVMGIPDLDDIKKADILYKLSESDRMLNEGGDEYLILFSILSFTFETYNR